MEILLHKNFLNAANYLIDEYYPQTRIDTDIIVKKVDADIRRQQNKLIYSLLENLNKGSNWPPTAEPIVYYAQSPAAIYLKVKIADSFDADGCGQTFNRNIEIGHNWVQVDATCIEDESNIKKYSRRVVFA